MPPSDCDSLTADDRGYDIPIPSAGDDISITPSPSSLSWQLPDPADQDLSTEQPARPPDPVVMEQGSVRLKTKELSNLTRRLATLLEAGMPLVPALSALAEQFGCGPAGQLLEAIKSDVNAGADLATALGRYPEIFSPLYVNMVAATEATGSLETALVQLAELLEKRARLTAKVKSAVAYPLLMAIASAAVVLFLMVFVIPTVTKIFIDMNQTLPWPTRFLIAAGAFLKDYLLILPLFVVVAILVLRWQLRSDSSRDTWDRLKLRLPLFGKLLLKTETARLARALGVLLGSGVPVLKAMSLSSNIVQNRHVAAKLIEAKKDIERGATIAQAIKDTAVFQPLLFHTIGIAELSGNIEEPLKKIADAYDDEIAETARSIITLLEPAVLLATGAIVGFIVLAILLPIFQINELI